MLQNLFATITNVSFDGERIDALIVQFIRKGTSSPWNPRLPFKSLWQVIPLCLLLYPAVGLREWQPMPGTLTLGKKNVRRQSWFYRGCGPLVNTPWRNGWISHRFGQVNLKCMALLDGANTGAYGSPVPTKVSMVIEKELSSCFRRSSGPTTASGTNRG